MKKYTHSFFFFLLFTGMCQVLLAQEEFYEKPAEIIDTLKPARSSSKDLKIKPQKEDAKTALEKKKENLNRLRIGGTFGLQFGSYTYVNLSPTVGYMVVKDRLELGAGPIFIYQRIRYNSYYAVSSFVYGADIYARGFLYKGLYLEARYDPVHKPSNFYFNRALWVHHLLLGAGYAAPIGGIGFIDASILYNVLNNDESLYRGTFSDKVPIIVNIGFGFGLGGK